MKKITKSLIIYIINLCLGFIILFVCGAVLYKYFIVHEGFDLAAEKISGTATFLNTNSPIANPADSEIKNNEQQGDAVSSPAEIAKFNKIVATTVPKSPKPLDINIAPASSGIIEAKTIKAPVVTSSPSQQFPKLNSTAPMDPSQLSPKEKQLFDAFLEERITDDKIVELIESGILTEAIVEKFLKMIDDLPQGPAVGRAPKKISKQGLIKNKNDNLLEGFSGSSYACAKGF
jgi:hypothetical protein